MRVLHVLNTSERRGAQVFAADLVRALNGEGVAQRIAVLHQPGPTTVNYAAPTSVLSRNGRSMPGLRIDLGAMASLRALVERWRPNVVQLHGGDSLKHAALQPRMGPAHLVYRRIGSSPDWMRGGARRLAYARLMRRAARVVAVADALRQEAIDVFNVPPHRVVTIPNGVDFDRLRPVGTREETRRRLGIPPTAPVVLSVGALTWEKDPLAHVEVAERVLPQRTDAFHLLAGDGPLRPTVEAAIRGSGLAHRLRLLGQRDDVTDLVHASDLVLLASRVEGVPGVAIEAGTGEVPVAAYAVGGVPEIVEEGVTGFLAPPGDVDRLAAHVATLMGDPGLRQRMGRAARRRVRTRHDIRTVARRYLDLYGDVS